MSFFWFQGSKLGWNFACSCYSSFNQDKFGFSFFFYVLRFLMVKFRLCVCFPPQNITEVIFIVSLPMHHIRRDVCEYFVSLVLLTLVTGVTKCLPGFSFVSLPFICLVLNKYHKGRYFETMWMSYFSSYFYSVILAFIDWCYSNFSS